MNCRDVSPGLHLRKTLKKITHVLAVRVFFGPYLERSFFEHFQYCFQTVADIDTGVSQILSSQIL